MNHTNDELREIVRAKYAEIASNASSCYPSNCGDGEQALKNFSMIGDAYDGVEGYVQEADLGLSCGVPVEHAGLEPGHTVLDLGSGAGLDVFVARNEVGTEGHVIGVDMTAEMIAKARKNTDQAAFDNVEFRLGEIENLPVICNTIDTVISNCVLNLVPNKKRAFEEIFRVLKPGGHFCISDIVASQTLPAWLSDIAEAYAGCVSGAIPKQEYLDVIKANGFEKISIVNERRIDVPAELLLQSLTPEQLDEVMDKQLHALSVTVTGIKPKGG